MNKIRNFVTIFLAVVVVFTMLSMNIATAAWSSNTAAEYTINISDKVKANAQFAPISIQAVNVGANGDTLTDVAITITSGGTFTTSSLSALNGNADGTSGIQFYLDNGTVGTFEPGTDAQFTLSPAPTFTGSGPWTVTLYPSASLPSDTTRNYLIVFDMAASPTDAATFRVGLTSVTWNNAGQKTDLATSWPSASTYGTIDTTVPTFSTRQTQDLDADGKLDAVKVTLSESVDDSTLAIGDFATSHATGFDTTFTGSFGGLTFTNGIATVTANDAVFYLKLVETAGTCSSSDATGCDTDATPTVTHTAGGITDHAGNALATTGAVATTDLAAPVPKYAKYKDTNTNGTVDRVDVTFSENIVSDTYTDGDYTVAATGTIVLADETALATSGDDVQLTALGGTNITGGATDPQITYTAAFVEGSNGLNDAAGNAVATFTVTATDAAAPYFSAASYKDTNTNGTVDSVDITFTEEILLDEYDDLDWAVTVAGQITLLDDTAAATTSATVLRLSTAADANETGDSGGAAPTMTYTAANGTANSVHDAAGNNTGDLTFADLTDLAVPQILSSTGSDSDNDGKTNTYVITFTENLTDKGTVSTPNNNFSARNAAASTTITVSSVGVGATAGGGANKVTLNLDDADTDNYTGSITFTYNSAGGDPDTIEDAAAGTNDFVSVTDTALTDDVAPVLLSARGANVGGTADVMNAATEFLEFTFSEPMNSTPPSIANLEAGLTFANGATDGTNLGGGTDTVTRTTRTMANDSYRVTQVDTGSTNLITPATDNVVVAVGTNILDTASVAANTNPAAVTVDSADIVPPTFSSRQTQDLDDNGLLDAIKVTMNEAIQDSTLTLANFAVDGYTVSSVNGNTAEVGDDADDDIFYLLLTELSSSTCNSTAATGCDTDAIPDVTYTAGTLKDASNNSAASTGAVAATDLASPIPMYGKYKDVILANGRVDRVDITFSEAIVSDGYDAGAHDADYTVAEAGTIILADETAVAVSGDDLQLTALGAANITGGATAPQVTYTSSFAEGTRGLNDAAGNAVATFTSTLTDAAAPFYLSSQTLDNNNDGTVDFVKVTYTESVLDSTVAAADYDAGVADVTEANLTETFTSLTPSSGNVTDVADDEIIYVGIASSGETIATKDTNYAIKIEQDAAITDATGNSYASFASQDSTDGAKPIIATVIIEDATGGDGLIDKITYRWSEPIDTNDAAVPVADDLPTTVMPDGVTAAFAGVTIDDTDGTGTDVVVTVITDQVTVNTAAASTTISGDLSAKWVDAAANTPHATGATGNEAITDSAKPVFKTSTTADTNLNGTVDQITIVYSETVAITDAAGGAFDGVTFANSCTAAAADYTSAGTTTSVVTVSSCTAGDTTITASPTYSLAAGTIEDLATIANEMGDSETVTGTDGAAPAVTALTVNDADVDGDMDTVVLTYSENLTNLAVGANGFNVTSASNHGTCNTESADPAVSTSLTLTFVCSTASTAVGDLNVVYTDADGGLVDSTGNQVGDKTLTSATTPAITDIAAPVPMTASITKAISNYNLQNSSVLTVTFSEAVTGTGVANGDWKFSRNGSEALATGNWPDGATVGYGGSGTTITMTLSAATTGGAWTSGAMLNMAANNTASIVDVASNTADLKATNITISGLIGPALDAIAITANTGTAATIAWTSSVATTGNVVNYGTTASLGSSSTAGSPGEGSTSHSVNLTGLTVSTLYYYQVCSTNVSQTCSSIYNFTSGASADVTGPTISDQTPADDATSQAVTVSPTLTFSEALAPTTVNSANIQLRTYADVQVAADVLYNPTTFVVTIDPQASLSYNTQYYLYASASVTDSAGNALTTDYDDSTKASHEFTTVAAATDTTDPVITNIQASPVGSVTATITWTTDESGTSVVEYGTSSAYGTTNSTTTLATSHSVSLTGLSGSTTYHFRVGSADAASNNASSTDNIFVTTATDVTGPTISGQTPSDNATGTAITVSPVLTFSEALDASTVNGATVQLRSYTDDVAISATVSYNSASTTVTVNPVSDLANNTQYYLWVVGVNDSAGNALTTDYSSSAKATHEFTTTAESVTLAVTQVAATQSYATANNTYASGWAWTFTVTAPTSQTGVAFKLSDFVSGANSVAATNFQYCSEQAGTYDCSDTAEDSATWVTLTAANTYPANITLSTDTDSSTAGRQFQIKVRSKVPAATAAGSYSGSYGIRTQ